MENRVFVYDGREFPDPDPSLTIDEVRQSMANFFPELSNAESKESKRPSATTPGEVDKVVEFKKRVGTKGEQPAPKLCRMGYCAKKDSHYGGGSPAVSEKLKKGICPICGGAAERRNG